MDTMSLATEIVTDFAVIMTVAALVTFLFHKLKQPLILGYLIAGMIVGPYTPPFSLVTRIDFLGAAAELGVILLLFGIGLEFPMARLRMVGRVSMGVAAIEIAFMLFLSYGVGSVLNWPLMDTLFLGVALASSSTAIIMKVLGDLEKLREMPALIMLGVLIVEDLFVVLMLPVLQSISVFGRSTLAALGWGLAKAMILVFGSLAIGRVTVPRIIERIVRIGRGEVLILASLGLCFGLSIVANRLGFSMAIGAFLMGVLIAESESAREVASLVSPLKDVFAAMFFVSIGALMDITQFRNFIAPGLMITLTMMSAKMLGCGLGTRAFGYDASTSLRVGLGMIQIGEFAFIVMKVGEDLGVISPLLFPTIGVVAVITTFLTPYLIKLSYEIG